MNFFTVLKKNKTLWHSSILLLNHFLPSLTTRNEKQTWAVILGSDGKTNFLSDFTSFPP
jgi:hypothetical protein